VIKSISTRVRWAMQSKGPQKRRRLTLMGLPLLGGSFKTKLTTQRVRGHLKKPLLKHLIEITVLLLLSFVRACVSFWLIVGGKFVSYTTSSTCLIHPAFLPLAMARPASTVHS
jgi:hypothetical protein